MLNENTISPPCGSEIPAGGGLKYWSANLLAFTLRRSSAVGLSPVPKTFFATYFPTRVAVSRLRSGIEYGLWAMPL